MAHPTKQKPEDIPAILILVREGKTYSEIARQYGISSSTLSDWLNKPEVAEQSARALAASAEAWLDRGLEELEKSSAKGAHRARYIAQECARRAGIRNMHYRERMGIDAKVGGNVTVQLVNFADLPDSDPEPVET